MPKKITRNIENISKRKLSIQFSLDGFSFCITNSENDIFHFSSYDFEEDVSSPELVLEKIQSIFQKDEDLHHDFDSVLVIHENNLNSFVPNIYFKEESLKSYLNYNVKTISTDFIAFDDLEKTEAKNVYVPYVNINNFLFQNFGEFEYRHHSSILVDKLIEKSNDDFYFYVNVSKKSIDIVVIEHQKLSFYNSFEYYSKEDFIYYILFVLEQLKIDPDKTPIHLLGEINKDSQLYQIAYTYIRTIHFVETSPFTKEEEQIENHSNFILLG